MKKHILVISQYFYPESFRINDIAMEFKNRGYKVTVLTGIPNYPDGKFYKGFNWFINRKEQWEGIDIIRIPLISRGHSAIRLILNYYSFVVSGFLWNVFSRIKPDLVFTFEVSPMTQALIGKWFSARRKIPSYLYVQDLWPENLEVVGGIHNKHVLAHYQKMSDKIYNSSTKIFATSPSFVKAIQDRIEDKNKVIYWPQYAENFYKPIEKKLFSEIPNDGRFKVVFTGNIGNAQGLDILPKASRLVGDDVCFVIVGNGRYKEQLIRDIGNEKNKFILIDRQPAEKIPEILASCDVAFLSFMDNPLFMCTIPAKLQSYMACGMPVLASATGETKRIIEEADCGICTFIGDEVALANAIKRLKVSNLEMMRENSQKYCKQNFNRKVIMDQMENYIGETCNINSREIVI